jgi:hypothetical protein
MALRGRASLGASGSAADDDDDDFYSGKGGAAEQQRLLVRDQDETISQLHRSVEKVHGMAVLINDDIRDQNKLLAEITDDVESTDSRLKSLHGKLRHLANDSDRGKYCLIVVLLIVLGILVLLVLS